MIEFADTFTSMPAFTPIVSTDIDTEVKANEVRLGMCL
jgi:hypothetical protein